MEEGRKNILQGLRQIVATLIVIAFLVPVCLQAQAQEQKRGSRTLTGTIVSFVKDSHILVRYDGGRNSRSAARFLITEKTRIDGRLAKGKKVSVVFTVTHRRRNRIRREALVIKTIQDQQGNRFQY